MRNRSVLLLIVGMLVVAPVVAGDGPSEKRGRNWCTLDGAWFVHPVETAFGVLGPYTINATMYSPHEGAAAVVWSGTDPTAWGLCPGAVEMTIAQGATARIGPRSFELTVITFSKDAMGAVVCIAKSVLWIELERGCHSGLLNGTLEFYFGNQDPFADDPYYCAPPTESDYLINQMTVDQSNPSCP